MHPRSDAELIQIVDAATADSARRSGDWLKCRPGCSQCCIGVFAISSLDAQRLRTGLTALESTNPEAAARIRTRARASLDRILPGFPGDPVTGLLYEDEASQAAFEDFANDEPCPVLDPTTGTCDLYSARPMTCRVFGPPLRTAEGIGICELNFVGASDSEVDACILDLDPAALESALKQELGANSGTHDPSATRETIVTFCVL